MSVGDPSKSHLGGIIKGISRRVNGLGYQGKSGVKLLAF